MEIISLHKRGKVRKTPRRKKHQSHLILLKRMTQAMMNRSLKNHQSQAMKKSPLQKQKKPQSDILKKLQSHLNLLKQINQAMMNKSLKKHQGHAMEKRPL